MTRRLRILEFHRRADWDGYQLLQEEHWWGWKTVERIKIPSHVLISRACFGDSGGWISPLVTKYGAPGTGGLIPQPGVQKRQVTLDRTTMTDYFKV